jgi:hypothetical protein
VISLRAGGVVAEQFHIGQQVRLTRTLATRPEGLFRRGATGTVMYMEEMVLIRMDQHFPQLDHMDNATWVKYSDITAETGGVLARLRAALRRA